MTTDLDAKLERGGKLLGVMRALSSCAEMVKNAIDDDEHNDDVLNSAKILMMRAKDRLWAVQPDTLNTVSKSQAKRISIMKNVLPVEHKEDE